MSKIMTAEHIRNSAAESWFDDLVAACEGTVAVDRQARVVWIDDKYKALLGIAGDVTGKPIEEVIPNSQLRTVVDTGKPMLLDIMEYGGMTFVVIRMPVRDGNGVVTGAIGFVLYEKADYLQPLFAKFSQLQEDLRRARKELAGERRAKYTFSQFLGVSEAVREVKRLARRAAQMDSTVLLLGETGTGKELLAHSIHAASARAGKRMVSINVAAIPENLLEAELFGAAPGAYTGADRKGREGKFQLADGGTLFLDEIGDMPFSMQSKLLRVLQERELEPLGSNRMVRVDVRIIAATSRDLAALVRSGEFRADLYYRLNVVPIVLPPLNRRPEDVEVLAESILDKLRLQEGGSPRELDASAIAVLAAYEWPGNVRELHNVLERVCTLTEAPVLSAQHFVAILPVPEEYRQGQSPNEPPATLTEAVNQAERSAIAAALRHAHGNKTAAARILGISRASLYERITALRLAAE
ncbi:MAG TPA: sigma 54-interacting transcriptional regulator [Candidatus Sulfotelmatobacter sp.]|jgi:transcriptional regulator with PAS, ATPase and Fis domain|nr:sigma 54-interacting transcriptional regulator [Candidatus Sulfotelmatobacter sp.]